MRNPHNLRVHELAVKLNNALARYHPPPKSPLYEAQRSAGSTEDNINEGCLRESEKEFLNHINYARASASEDLPVRASANSAAAVATDSYHQNWQPPSRTRPSTSWPA